MGEMNKQVERSNNTISSLNYTANMSLEYSAINDLQLEDMSPKSWWNYVKRLAKSQANLCNEKDTATISNSSSIECKEIEQIVDQYHETKNKKGAWWQKLIGKLF